jgi:hypothetical protein
LILTLFTLKFFRDHPSSSKTVIVCDDRTAVVYSDGIGFVNEAEENLADALSPIYDQISLVMYWWILEWILPQTIEYQSGSTDLMVSEIRYREVRAFFSFFFLLLTKVVMEYFLSE